MTINRRPPTYREATEAFKALGKEETLEQLEEAYNKLLFVREQLDRYITDMAADIANKKGVTGLDAAQQGQNLAYTTPVEPVVNGEYM